MNLYINSTLKVIPNDVDSIGKLIDFLHIARQGTGVGLNNHLIPSRDWDNTRLKEEDRLLIISATYGG